MPATQSVPQEDLYELPCTFDEVEAELAERSLYEFVRVSWPVLHPGTAFTDGWHIGAMAAHLEALVSGEIRKLLITVAPRSTKSVTASVCLPAWAWIKNPALTWLYSGYNKQLSTEHSVWCRRLIESPWYQRHWGDKFTLTSDQNEKTNFENSRQGRRTAFGLTSITGHGADLNINDDAHDRGDWKHPTVMKTAIDQYDSVVYPSVNDPNKSRHAVILQRIASGDLAGHLIAQGGWEHVLLPTEYDPKRSKVTVIGWKDPRTKEGQLLCENRYSQVEVDALKKANRRTFEAHHNQNPRTDEGAIFKRMNWRFYQDDPKDIAPLMDVIIQSWDLTSGGPEPGTSKVAGHVWGMRGANKFLLDRVLAYMDMVETIRQIRAMTARWPQAKAKVIEIKAAGPGAISLLKDEIAGIISWPPKGAKMDNKMTRALIWQPEHEAGNLTLPLCEKVPWAEEVIELCAAFPEGEFDDDIDAMTQALAYFERLPTGAAPQGVGSSTRWIK